MAQKKELKINEEVEAKEVRLIGEEGEQIGIVPIAEARELADKAEIDLVEISPTAEPPVCRIMDYGKYKYQIQKRDHDQRKKTHNTEMKQIRIKTFRIDPHDLGIKMKQARSFIESGHRLQVSLMFRAREHSHADMGRDLLVEHVAKPLEDVAKIDSPPRKDGRRMIMILSPVPNLKKVLQQRESEKKRAQKMGKPAPDATNEKSAEQE